MAGNFKVDMTLTAHDEASKVLQKSLKDTTKAATETQKAVEKVGKTEQKGTEQTVQGIRTVNREAKKAAEARAVLGVRSERNIQREIDKTIASYNRVARTASTTAYEQNRAFDASRARVSRLRQEMAGLTRDTERAGKAAAQAGNKARSSSGGGFGGAFQGAVSVVGGVTAAGAVMAQPIMKRMDYDSALASIANTAFSEGGIQGRLKGRKALDSTIRKAVNYGGGTKEGGIDALNALLASGMSYESSAKLLPQLMKYGTASGTSPIDLANIAITGKRKFGLKDADIPNALNMAITAGKAGSFELRDMAQYLPDQMAFAASAGMKGLTDFSKILTLNEAAATSSGSTSVAANNVKNLLEKLKSPDSINTARHIQYNGHGIDLPGTLAQGVEHGIDPIEAFSRMTERVAAANPQYRALEKRLSEAKGNTEKESTLASMAAILESSAVGQLVPDQQALQALLAYRSTPEYRKQVEARINRQRTLANGQREGDIDYLAMTYTDKNKVERAANAHDFAQMDSVKNQSQSVGNIAQSIARLETEFPQLASTVEGATTAIKAMTAAAVTFAGLKFLTGGGGAAAAGGATAAAEGSGAAATAAAKSGGIMGVLGRILGPAMGVTAAATFTTRSEDEASNGSKARWARIHAKYPQKVIDAARKKYQPWYEMGEGYSTDNERWLRMYTADPQSGINNALPSPGQIPLPGGAAGMPAGKVPAGSAPASTAPGQSAPTAPLHVTTQLVVDGQVLAETVNHYNVMDGNRATGGTPP